MTLIASPSCQRLSNLNLSDNNLGVSGLQALENTVGAGWMANLKNLNLSGCLTNDADTNATALVSLLKSLSAHCPYLDGLDLSDNNLGVPGASGLAVAISQHNNFTLPHYRRQSLWLTSINLNNTKLGDDGLCAFIVQLESPYCFSNLFLQNNSIHPTGLKCLAGMVHTRPASEADWNSLYPLLFCYDLDLRDNPIGIEGIITVGEVLGNCEQHRVDLSGCHLTGITSNPPSQDIIYRDLGQLLCQMTKSYITCLCLDCNSFTGECIHILTGFIHLCVQLITLSTKDCNITSDDLIQLLEIIAKSKHHAQISAVG